MTTSMSPSTATPASPRSKRFPMSATPPAGGSCTARRPGSPSTGGVLRILTDNAKVYRVGTDWRAVCVGLGLRPGSSIPAPESRSAGPRPHTTARSPPSALYTASGLRRPGDPRQPSAWHHMWCGRRSTGDVRGRSRGSRCLPNQLRGFDSRRPLHLLPDVMQATRSLWCSACHGTCRENRHLARHGGSTRRRQGPRGHDRHGA